MPRCPKCGKEITYLINFSEVVEQYKFCPRDPVKYVFIDKWGSGVNEYVCPECEAVLFDNERDAEKFLLNS